MTDDKAGILADVCAALVAERVQDAVQILSARYPFTPLHNAGRRYSPRQLIAVHRRDGFVDRYTGRRLVFPGTLRLLAQLLPEQFPFHPNWRTDACHFAFYELFPTLDHVVPVSRGGSDNFENWVTTSMLRNAAKANFMLGELNWFLHPPGDLQQWDGLTTWFLDWAAKHKSVLTDAYLRRWHDAARSTTLDAFAT